MELRYPNARTELIAELEAVADLEVALRGGQHYLGRWVPAWEVVETLVHDLLGAASPTDATALVGKFLYDDEEAAAVAQLLAAFDELFGHAPSRLSDEELVAAPEWPRVQEAAENARAKLLPRS